YCFSLKIIISTISLFYIYLFLIAKPITTLSDA
ncbi:MFS transporter, partial [Salmonella enterica subsp. enterica serovar Poona]